MVTPRTGREHRVRIEIFQRGLRRGFLTVQEIESSLPAGALTASERWLLYYSLRAAEIAIRDETGALVSVPALSPEELEQLASEAVERRSDDAPGDVLAGHQREVEQAEEALGGVDENPVEPP